jgi:hypothetical protein
LRTSSSGNVSLPRIFAINQLRCSFVMRSICKALFQIKIKPSFSSRYAALLIPLGNSANPSLILIYIHTVHILSYSQLALFRSPDFSNKSFPLH